MKTIKPIGSFARVRDCQEQANDPWLTPIMESEYNLCGPLWTSVYSVVKVLRAL